jgi:hypothetical protein
MELRSREASATSYLSAQELLAGSNLVHEVEVPAELLRPRLQTGASSQARTIRIRPLTLGALAVISRAARDDASLAPLLMIREAVVEPALSVDQVRQMHVGLVHFLLGEINEVSGLGPDGELYERALQSPNAKAQLLLAKHFGWTPDQVAALTPAQVMVYLAGIERLLAYEERKAEETE